MAQQKKSGKAPAPGRGGPRPKVENPGKLLKRIMDEVFRNYAAPLHPCADLHRGQRAGNVQASLFLQTLMDDYIVPMTQQQNPVSFAPLAGRTAAGGLHLRHRHSGRLCTTPVMVNVTQGTLKQPAR